MPNDVAFVSLKRVTLQLIWEEHRAQHPAGYGYSRFCDLYRAWEKRLSPTMRQTHVAGEWMFGDYAGTTMEVIDALIGEVANLPAAFARQRRQKVRNCRNSWRSSAFSAVERGRDICSALGSTEARFPRPSSMYLRH